VGAPEPPGEVAGVAVAHAGADRLDRQFSGAAIVQRCAVDVTLLITGYRLDLKSGGSTKLVS
jgi:hypothetical protein